MDWKCKVEEELKQLDERRTLLDNRLRQPQGAISDRQWELMHQQADAMTAYGMILEERLVEAKNVSTQ